MVVGARSLLRARPGEFPIKFNRSESCCLTLEQAFFSAVPGHFRLVYTSDEAAVQIAVKRLGRALDKLKSLDGCVSTRRDSYEADLLCTSERLNSLEGHSSTL
jgi:hypothetical protein